MSAPPPLTVKTPLLKDALPGPAGPTSSESHPEGRPGCDAGSSSGASEGGTEVPPGAAAISFMSAPMSPPSVPASLKGLAAARSYSPPDRSTKELLNCVSVGKKLPDGYTDAGPPASTLPLNTHPGKYAFKVSVPVARSRPLMPYALCRDRLLV